MKRLLGNTLFLVSLLCMVLTSCEKEKKDYNIKETEFEEQTEGKGSMLMSFNVRYGSAKADSGTSHVWLTRKYGVFKMIKTKRPVLMGVQECEWSQRTDILENCTDYDAIGVGRTDGKEKGESMSIFYLRDSIAIEDWGTFWLSDTPDAAGSIGPGATLPRSATWARVRFKASGKKLFYINTHLDTHAEARGLEMEVIAAKFEELNTEHLPQVLSADFNTRHSDPIFNIIDGKMFSARSKATLKSDDGNTYNAYGSGTGVIDHIFFSDLNVLSFNVDREPYEDITYISDHYPVYMIFRFK